MAVPPFKISFCTVCMNRLHHLRETLPINLANNRSYPYLEFVLLDYNSSDGLARWVASHLQEHLESGRLIYYRTNEPQYFHRSHSRNMVFKLASGDIVCNIDADNFTGENFAHYVNEQFAFNPNAFVAADTSNRHYFIRDVCGRICFWKKDFERTGGFDERMEGYGDEDIDLINRLKLLGRQETVILDHKFLKAIQHSDLERVRYEATINTLASVYVAHLTPALSSVWLLFRDGSINAGTLLDKIAQQATQLPTVATADLMVSPNDQYELVEMEWQIGSWTLQDDTMHVVMKDRQLLFLRNEDLLQDVYSDETYFLITDEAMVVQVINFHSRMKNATQLKNNKARQHPLANVDPVGRGTVTKNFNEDVLIDIM